MPLASLDHITINTAKPDETVEFYTNLLGMRDGWRPPLDRPGKWLYVGDHPVIHLFFVDDATQAETGDFDHFAFLGSDFAGMKEKLVTRGIEFRENKVAGGLDHLAVLPDPNNVKVEIRLSAELIATSNCFYNILAPRLKTKLQVQAAIRLGATMGIQAVVARHGDDDAGVILIERNRRDSVSRCWRRPVPAREIWSGSVSPVPPRSPRSTPMPISSAP